MYKRLVRIRKRLASYSEWLRHAELRSAHNSVNVLIFIWFQIVRFPIRLVIGLIEIPLHLHHSPMEGFNSTALRNDKGVFLESYSAYIKRMRMSIAVVMLAILGISTQFFALGYGLWIAGRPQKTLAYTGTVTLYPTWNIMAVKDEYLIDDPELGGICTIGSASYLCASSTTTLNGGGTSAVQSYPLCVDSDRLTYYPVMKFNLSSIPTGATITSATFSVYVNYATTGSVTLVHPTSDTPDSVSCVDPGTNLFGTIFSGTTYLGSQSWSSTGTKSYTLPAQALTDIHNRISTINYALGFKVALGNHNGRINSVTAAEANRPKLVINYSALPQTPSVISHSATTTDSITWTWTDNATNDTDNVIHNVSNTVKCSAGAVAGTGSTGSCLESGLSPNTQYTRHVNVADAEGNTDGAAAAVYTLPMSAAAIGMNISENTETWLSAAPQFSRDIIPGTGTYQYFRYVWDTNAAHTFTGTETSWDGVALTPTSTVSSNSYYFHVQTYNGDNVASSAAAMNYGPYYVDVSAPSAPAAVNVSTYNTSLTHLPVTWEEATDLGSGINEYEYAVGTMPGSTDVTSGWISDGTDTSATITGLSLSDGETYYVSTRAVDLVNNVGLAATSSGVIANTAAPMITDHQTGDATPRKAAGTTYNVDFAKASTGPQLTYAQYAVGSSGGGSDVIGWTDIFRSSVNDYDTNWSVDFDNLDEGTNYVSVRVGALDGLTDQLNSAFTIIKDTIAPLFSSFVSAPAENSATLTWTSSEPTTTQLEYGTSPAYGSTTTANSALTTEHSVALSGLAATTTFHARALGTDEAGNSAVSADLEFSTAAGAHTYISDVHVTPISSSSVTVSWTTNEPATSKVRYGTSTDYGSEAYDASLVTSHSITLTGLTPGTGYHYEVISVGSTTDHDADATFVTSGGSSPVVTTPTVNTVVLPTQQNDPLSLVFTGYGGQTVTIYVDGRAVRNINLTGSTSKKKSFTAQINVSRLSNGRHYVSLRAKNVDRELSAFTKRVWFTVNHQSEKIIITSRTSKYLVQRGDSLWLIAQKFLGRGGAYTRIVHANIKQLPALVSNPALIRPGMLLIIPAK